MIYLYGINTQTYQLSHQANTLTYALHHSAPNSKMLGLKHIKGNLSEYMSVVKLQGRYFTVCTVVEDKKVRRWESSDVHEAEHDLIKNGYIWLVTMPGCDDHCGYTRFKTLEDAKKWYISNESIDYSNDRYWMVN